MIIYIVSMTNDVSMEHWLNNDWGETEVLTTETCASAHPRVCLLCRSSSHDQMQKILIILFSAPTVTAARTLGLANRSDQPPRMKSSRVLSNCNLSPRGRTATRGRWFIASLLCPELRAMWVHFSSAEGKPGPPLTKTTNLKR